MRPLPTGRSPGPSVLPTPREYVARQYEKLGQRDLAAKIRTGAHSSDKVLLAIRAVNEAQMEAIMGRGAG